MAEDAAAREFPSRPAALWRAGLGVVLSLAAAGTVLPLALVGLPLMTSVAVIVLLAYAGSLVRSILRERAADCPPRLAWDAEGVRMRAFGGRRVQALPWSLVGRLRVEEGAGWSGRGRLLVVELAPGKRMRGGEPLALPIGELPPDAEEAIREADALYCRG